MHTPDVLFLCVCACVCGVCSKWEEGDRVWLLLWVLVVGPGLPTDGHRAGWVLGISHIQLYQCLYQSVCSQSFSFSISLSPCLPLFLSSLGGRKIKVFCFLCKIFVSAFWVYLKIKLSLIRCLSLSVCKQSDVWQTLLSAVAIIKLQIMLRELIPLLFACKTSLPFAQLTHCILL